LDLMVKSVAEMATSKVFLITVGKRDIMAVACRVAAYKTSWLKIFLKAKTCI